YRINLSSLKYTFVCGEPFPVSFAKSWLSIAPDCQLINFYGPTEATVACTFHVYDQKDPYTDLTCLPIGFPFSSTEIHLDENHEIHIFGPQVARGYYLSSDNPSAFMEIPDKKTWRYKTGDLAQFNRRYGYCFLGRKDDQWQICGVRIEKGEVEHILRSVLGISDIRVVAKRANQWLIDYLVLFSKITIDLNKFSSQLKSALPLSAIPKKTIYISEFPTLPNGKTDYKALETYIGDFL
ncbi:MAG TPA: AMP-binding protein, partial [Rickettsiales bacterium]|nr:AMP-binding protein [Rickettsiales bacterium]